VAASLLGLAACGAEPTPQATASTPGTPTTTPVSPTTSSPTVDATEIEVEVENGEVRGPREVSVKAGERIVLTVRADVADEVHVHSYDLLADVAPGQPATIRFKADIVGVFEVELESASLLLFRLKVNP
jgi:hypothetical protein